MSPHPASTTTSPVRHTRHLTRLMFMATVAGLWLASVALATLTADGTPTTTRQRG